MFSNGSRVRAALLVSSLNLSQSAFLKFHRLTGLLEVGATSRTGVMSDGWCWDLGNFSSTRRVENGWSSVVLAKARSGFNVPEVQRTEWKLSGSFRLYKRQLVSQDKFHHYWIWSNPIQCGGSWNCQRRCSRGGWKQVMMLWSGVLEVAYTC